jgi:hypothetical protein
VATTFFSGALLDADDFTLDQDAFRGRSRAIALAIREDGSLEEWIEVPSLDESGPDDRHFTLDRETGRVTFGDGEHGRRPAAGSLVEATYRCGSGRSGNRAWLGLAVGAALAGFVAAFVSHRRP